MSISGAIDLTLPSQDVEERIGKLKVSPDLKPKKKTSSLPPFLPPCRVCNATASGYHYGAITCEPCKAFFRRSIGHEDTIKPCESHRKCAENPNGKISCTDCRHKKCLSVGMTKEGSKKGRYTYETHTQNTKEVKRMHAEENLVRHFEVQQCAETVAMLASQFEQSFDLTCQFLLYKEKIDLRVEGMVGDLYRGQNITRVLYSPGHSPSVAAQNWCEAVNSLMAQVSCHPEEESVPTTLAHSMVFDVFTSQTEKDYHGLASFAKCLPGFSELLLADRIILLKQCQADAIQIIKHKTMYRDIGVVARFEIDTGDLFLFPILILRNYLGDDFADCFLSSTRYFDDSEESHEIAGSFRADQNSWSRMIDLCSRNNDVKSRIQKLNLTLEDMAVLLAFVILAPDREGLQHTDLVEQLQDKMLLVLQYCLQKNHPEKPNIMADTLLILPLLRESTEISKRSLESFRNHKIKPEMAPLVAEMLQP